MEKSRMNLYAWGWILIAFTVVDLFQQILENINGKFRIAIDAATVNADPMFVTFLNVILAVSFAILTISIIAQAYLGIRAVQISRNPCTNTAHITIAKIGLVLSILLTISGILSMISGSDIVSYLFSTLLSLIDVIILLQYIKDAKAVRELALAARK